MKTLKFLYLLFILSLLPLTSKAAITGQWKVYPTFDNNVSQIIDTPETVYFTALPQPYNKTVAIISEPLCNLFSYDKKSGELRGLSIHDKLSEPLVRKIAYNPYKKYLIVVYDNLNIDFIYDNGKIENIAGLMNSNLPGKKEIYNITFDNEKDGVYIGTEFGYILLNDKKHEITESRNYGSPIWNIIRVGDRIMYSNDEMVFMGWAKDPRFNLSDYSRIGALGGLKYLLPMDDSHFIAIQGNKSGEISSIKKMEIHPAILYVPGENAETLGRGMVNSVTYQEDGYLIRLEQEMMKVNLDGSRQIIAMEAEDKNKAVDSYDFKTFWKAEPRKGMLSKTYIDKVWTRTSDYIAPNSPSTFMSFNITYHPKYGMLVPGRGLDGRFLSEFYASIPPTMAVLRNGFWSDISPLWRDPDNKSQSYNLFGLAIDPDDSKYVYRGSFYNGITRYNLDDPKDVLYISHPSDPNASLPGFVAHRPSLRGWAALCRLHNPQFDNDGNLLSIFNNVDDKKVELYRWSPEARRASKDAASFRPFDIQQLPFKGSNGDQLLVLRHKRNANKIIIWVWEAQTLYVLDHNGTFDTTADDKLIALTSTVNQDGTNFSIENVATLFEDPQTGLIWVGSSRGLFTFNPLTIGTNKVINQIKVSRNDGTSLADYLLNEINVYDIMDDGQGRKWFATNGAGLVCTTSDGRKVLGEFTRQNSYIPDDLVYSSAYNPETGSILVSTDKGIAEFFPSVVSSEKSQSEVRAYPNPVNPDYYGFVTIDNLPENALVKIADAQGNIVSDLGISESGSTQWDVTGLDKRRVKTGVYYILVSGSSSGSGSSVGKILIMN